MSEGGNMIYLGLCIRYEPPIIGVHYKQKETDTKKKVYTILLQRLVHNPNTMEAAEQLYLEHPHVLRKDKISIEKIAALIKKIQVELNIGEEGHQGEDREEGQGEGEEDEDEHYEQEYEEDQDEQAEAEAQQQAREKEVVKPKQTKFDFDFGGRDDGPLNRSM